jgi:hypothetical protein
VQTVLSHFERIGICRLKSSDGNSLAVQVIANNLDYLKFFVKLSLPEFEMYAAVLAAGIELSKEKRKFTKEECLKLAKAKLNQMGSQLNPNLIVVFGNRLFEGFSKGNVFVIAENSCFKVNALKVDGLNQVFL